MKSEEGSLDALRQMSHGDLVVALEAALESNRALREAIADARSHLDLARATTVHQLETELQNRQLRATQEALETAMNRQHLLVELAPVPYLTLDRRGVVREINHAGLEMLGRSASDVIGKVLTTLFDFHDVGGFWRHLGRSAEEDGVTVTELELTAPTRRSHSVRVVSAPVTEGVSGKREILMVLIDVTEQKRGEVELASARDAERAMRRQLESLASSHAIIGEALAVVEERGIEHVLETVADQARHLVDAEYAAVGIARSSEGRLEFWAQSGMPVDRASESRPLSAHGLLGVALAAGDVLRFRDVREHAQLGELPPGHPETTSFLSVPIHHFGDPIGVLYLGNKRSTQEFVDEDAQLLQMLATRIATGIEAALVTQRAVEQRSWIQAVIDQMPHGVVIEDPEGYTLANQKAQELGIDTAMRDHRPTAAARPGEDGFPAEGLTRTTRRLAIASGESSLEFEGTTTGKGGREIPFRASTVPIKDPQGRILGAVTSIQDITASKIVEQLREEWAAVIAHDLRQPLQLISFAALTLHDPKTPHGEEIERALRSIRKAVEDMTRMIEDLADTSILEAKRLTLNVQRVRVRDIIDAALDTLPKRARPGTIRVEIAQDVDVVECDGRRIEQVLSNLLSNAVKYGQRRGEVIIDARRMGDRLQVSVCNEGETLSPEELAHLFDRFYRTPGATKVSAGGHGLGLYIAAGLVEAHGGQISASSQGGTTTFSFNLPLTSSLRA